MTVAIEALWEVLENSPFVIERYRTQTAALGYEGDSVANSLGDILSCAIGFALARRLGFWGSVLLFGAIELALLIWIRDSLLLSVLMLIHSFETIRNWQMACTLFFVGFLRGFRYTDAIGNIPSLPFDYCGWIGAL